MNAVPSSSAFAHGEEEMPMVGNVFATSQDMKLAGIGEPGQREGPCDGTSLVIMEEAEVGRADLSSSTSLVSWVFGGCCWAGARKG